MDQWETRPVEGGAGGRGGEGEGWGTPESGRARRKRRRWRRVALWGGGGVLLLLVIALVLAPTIASSVAPGYIEGAADSAIPGSVEVRGLRVGWGGPTVVGPVRLFDEQGKPVGTVEVSVPAGLWRVVTERWWGRKSFELGTVVVSGNLDVVRGADGTTNLERALGVGKAGGAAGPSQPGKPGKTEMPPAGIERVRGTVRLDSIDATFTDQTAPPGSATAQGLAMRGLAGDIAVDYSGSRRGLEAEVKADLAAAIRSGPGTGQAGQRQTIVLNATADLGPNFDVRNIDAALRVSDLSTALVDLVAGYSGELEGSIGPRMNLAVTAVGTPAAGQAALEMAAEGAGADVKLDYDGQRLTLREPGRVWARSTGFVAGMDAARDGLDRAGEVVRLSRAPGFELALETLSIPVTTAQLTGGNLMEQIDLRGAQLGMRLTTEAVEGEMATQRVGEEGGAAGETVEAGWRPFRVEPLEVAVRTDDLAQGVRLTSSTRATVDGERAGTVAVDILAAGLLDAQGRPVAGVPGTINGEARISEVASALVQPIVEGMGLPIVLGEDVGPVFDLALTAATAGGQPVAGEEGLDALPPTNINAGISSRNINGTAALRLERGVATTRDGGVVLRIASAGPLIGRLTGPWEVGRGGEEGAEGAPEPLTIGGRGGIEVTVGQLRMPLGDQAATLEGVAAQANIVVTELSVGVRGEQIEIGRAAFGVDMPVDAGPRAQVDVQMAHRGNPFTAAGDLTLARFRGQWPMPKEAEGGIIGAAVRWEPRGQVQVKGIPASLSALAPGLEGEPAGPDDVAGHVRAMVRAIIGQQADVTLAVAPAEGADGAPAIGITAAAYAGAAAMESALRVTEREVSIVNAGAYASLRPQDVDPVLAAASARPAAGDPNAMPTLPMRLRSPVTLRAGIEPVSIPWNEGAAGSPNLGAVSELVVTLRADEPVLIENAVAGGGADGGAETAGVGALAVRVVAPGGVLTGAEPSRLRGKLNAAADVLHAPVAGGGGGGGNGGAHLVGKLVAEAAFPMDFATFESSAELREIRTGALDALLGQGGTLVGALGETGVLRLRAMKRSETRMAIETRVEMQRLTGSWVPLVTDGERLWLVAPVEMTWTPDVAWINRTVMAGGEDVAQQQQPAPRAPAPPVRGNEVIGAAPGAQPPPGGVAAAGAQERPVITELAPLTLNLEGLSVAMPKSDPATGEPIVGPLRPGAFILKASAATPRVVMDQGGGRGAVTLAGVRMTVGSPAETSAVTFEVTVDEVSGGGVAQGSERARVTGVIEGLADNRGVITADAASLTMNGSFPALPTPLVDSLARQDGLLTEAIGPTVSVTLQSQDLSREGGTLRATAVSERARATIAGQIEDGAFVQTGETQVTLSIVTPELVRELGGSLPVVGTLEKRRTDEPGIVRGENLTIPVDGDLSKLNGRITVDPGVARFTTAGGFASLLKATGQRQEGQLGRKLDPFVVNIHNGVLSYDRFKLSLGEFSLETTGSVDLVNRRMDIVTYVPFFAVTDEVAGLLSTNLAGAIGQLPGGIDRATLVPIRTRGSLDGPKSEVDTGLFVQQFGKGLLETPERLLDDVLRKRIEELVKPKGGGGR